MAIKRVKANLGIEGALSLAKPNDTISGGAVLRTRRTTEGSIYVELICSDNGNLLGGCSLSAKNTTMFFSPVINENTIYVSIGSRGNPFTSLFGKKFIVPNGTSAQFLKADGSLDENAYALQTDLNTVKNNAWKLDIANPECETVVLTLQQGQGIFEAMAKAGIDYSQSRNIYVDLSEAGEWSGENLFAGYENAPIGVRYHIFFGNVKTAIKLYWASNIESNKLSGGLALTAEYPTAKCEFMRVTDSWTYADWEALIDEVSHVIDTGTASESDNSTLMNYMDNNKINYTKTAKGALVNITALLAALAGNGK